MHRLHTSQCNAFTASYHPYIFPALALVLGDITLTAQHLPGVLNTIADEESRVMKDIADWMLNPAVIREIQKQFGPLEVDLFASRLSAQLPTYFSWRPDPEILATDAFTQDWTSLKGYANPPWGLLNRVLAQTRLQEANLILVAPVWKAQMWYPALLGMLMDYLALIHPQEDLMLATFSVSQPATTPQLAVWPISGKDIVTTKFQKKLRSSCSHHGGRSPPSHTTHFFKSGPAGALNRIPILFRDL